MADHADEGHKDGGDRVEAVLITAEVAMFEAALPASGRLLGMDLGTRTIGLALSDYERLVATPLTTIRRTKFKTDAAILLAIIEEHDIRGLVLGLPINMNGSEGPRVQATRAFAQNVARLTPLPILYWDERLSTAAAERSLLEADTSRRRRAELVDKVAAAIILQGLLERLRGVVG